MSNKSNFAESAKDELNLPWTSLTPWEKLFLSVEVLTIGNHVT
jgi:hypothetical protein